MAPLAMAAIPAVIGAMGARKDAKAAAKAAAKGVDSTEKTTRTPYGPATSHIQTILDEAGRLYGQGRPDVPMPYAWQNFMNNPTSPGVGADPTYGGASPQQGGGANLNWRGRDRSEVQAAKAAKQQARTEARKPPAGQSGPGAAAGGGGMGMAAGSAQANPGAAAGFQQPFNPQQGPFGYSQGIRDYMMQNFLGQGVGGYQPAMNYIQGLLGGQSQNPFLTQTFDRLQAPRQDYFAAFRPK